MNRTQLKNYAPAARRDFISAITNRARTLGITETIIANADVQGDVMMVDGRPFPVAIAPLRKKLVERIQRDGFEQVIQAMAYTWFNRFVAIRYMELHGYLDHGFRVLSHPQGQNTPEILQQASHVDLPGLNKDQVIDFQLDGNKDAELYRMLLTAQCNALHNAMPFLFERIDDETELLLPDNLLHSDSVIRKLVNDIDEDNWNEIEIIGWLYQFYISERKDEVMGKVVKSADIPAATQLFTPNWIVKYLVQNSIGSQWLATYPDSDLKERMDYYIEPAEQTDDVKQQLAAITPDELNPEELTLIDPACGSGHILVEAYDLFKELYRERGYPRHKIPKLILEKNLYGLDIDTRAAQMAGFALLMKARADSPRVLNSTPKINVHALHDMPADKANEYSAIFLDAYLSKDQNQPQGLFSSVLPMSDAHKAEAIQFLDRVASVVPKRLTKPLKGKKPEQHIKARLAELFDVMGAVHDIASECLTIKHGCTDVFAYLYDRIDHSSSSLNMLFEWYEKLAELEALKQGRDINQYWDAVESYLNVLLAERDKIGQWCQSFKAIYPELNQGRKYYQLMMLFEQGCTFGSLIQVPDYMKKQLPEILDHLATFAEVANDTARRCAQEVIENCLVPAELLASEYDAVVANPPYMGRRGMNKELKEYIKSNYPNSIWDIYSAFIEKAATLSKECGISSMITMHTWMFLPAFEQMREELLTKQTIKSLAHFGANAFDSISGEVVQTAAFSLKKYNLASYKGTFLKLISGKSEKDKTEQWPSNKARFCELEQQEFFNIPCMSISYWLSKEIVNAFDKGILLRNLSEGESLNLTGNNDLFLRLHWEVCSGTVGYQKKWLFYAKGGQMRKWFGNFDYTINWSHEAVQHYRADKTARIIPELQWYKEGITWTKVTMGEPGFRYLPHHATYDVGGSSIIIPSEKIPFVMSFLNTPIAREIIRALNPSVNLQVGNILSLPLINDTDYCENSYQKLIELSKFDWNICESSWDFQKSPLISANNQQPTIKESYFLQQTQNHQIIDEVKKLEEENNSFFINTYGLQDELTSEVPIEQITLTVNPPYRYGTGKTEEEYETLFRTDTMKELVSYAIGCMMGRYSLDQPGLVYAHAGNEGFDAAQYKTYPVDHNGIIPITDTDWFDDDACNRLVQFIETAWPKDKRDENLMYLAEGLGKKASEAPADTLRRYLSKDFYKDHLKTYKKRPIYWLFSSGKHKAFECLVYLHRYNEGTLSRMRIDYVQPLLGKYESRIKLLRDNIEAASSTSARKKMEKELTLRQNQQLELRKYDEQLRHYTDQRISLDLDDGVKVNYGKFGTLLANVKDVTGKKA